MSTDHIDSLIAELRGAFRDPEHGVVVVSPRLLARAAAALEALRSQVTTPPSDDEREALEEWSFEHRPILSMRDGSIASCKCMDRVFINGQEDWDQHIADAILAFENHRRLAKVPRAALEAARDAS